jgi:hypothetical protein
MCALSDSRPAAVIDIEKEGKLTGKVTARLQCERPGAAALIAVEQAEKDGEKLGPGRMASHISDAVDAGTNLATGLEGVISMLDRIVKVGDIIAEVRICYKCKDLADHSAGSPVCKDGVVYLDLSISGICLSYLCGLQQE